MPPRSKQPASPRSTKATRSPSYSRTIARAAASRPGKSKKPRLPAPKERTISKRRRARPGGAVGVSAQTERLDPFPLDADRVISWPTAVLRPAVRQLLLRLTIETSRRPGEVGGNKGIGTV